MDDVGGGGAFGLEQGEHIEGMRCELKGACLPIIVQPGNTHVAIVEEVLILERRAEVVSNAQPKSLAASSRACGMATASQLISWLGSSLAGVIHVASSRLIL